MKHTFICKDCVSRKLEKPAKPRRSRKDNISPVLSGFVRMHREKMGFSQKELAKHFGFQDAASVSAWERGVRVIPTFNLHLLSELLDVPQKTLIELRELDISLNRSPS